MNSTCYCMTTNRLNISSGFFQVRSWLEITTHVIHLLITYLFLIKFLYYFILSLPNKVWETYCFCSVSSSYYYYYSLSLSLSPFFPRTMNLSTAYLRNYWTEFHETLWSYRYMFLVGPKVFSFVVKVVKVIKWAAQIQHCPISSKFDMWVDNDVPNWFPTLKNFFWIGQGRVTAFT